MITNNKEKSSGQIFKLNVTNYDNGLFETRVAGSSEDDDIKSNNDNYRENVLDKNDMTGHLGIGEYLGIGVCLLTLIALFALVSFVVFNNKKKKLDKSMYRDRGIVRFSQSHYSTRSVFRRSSVWSILGF